VYGVYPAIHCNLHQWSSSLLMCVLSFLPSNILSFIARYRIFFCDTCMVTLRRISRRFSDATCDPLLRYTHCAHHHNKMRIRNFGNSVTPIATKFVTLPHFFVLPSFVSLYFLDVTHFLTRFLRSSRSGSLIIENTKFIPEKSKFYINQK
jgi:hypothetical protein